MRIRAIAAKAAQMLLLFFLLVAAVFFLSRLAPGDPLRAYYGQSVERMSPSARAAAEHKLRLDQPLTAQFVIWVKNALSGDFGISFQYKQDVLAVVGGRWQNTLVLGGASFLLTFALAVPLGIYCASHAGSFADRLLCRLGAALSCIPVFFLALLLIAVFSVRLGLLPSSGAYPIGAAGSLPGRLRHLVLPACTIALGHFWHYAYLVRSRLLGELESEYVLFLRAKGVPRRRILYRHCLRAILPSLLAMAALAVPHLAGGAYVVEKVFSYPGLGALCFEAAQYHDYNLLLVLCVLTGALVVLCSLAAELLSAWADPRLRREGARHG